MGTLKGKYILLSERAEEEADGTVSAFCDELGLATCSETREGALQRLRRIMKAVLDDATKTGDIQDFLENRAIPLHDLGPDEVLISKGKDGGGYWFRGVGTLTMGNTVHVAYSAEDAAQERGLVTTEA